MPMRVVLGMPLGITMPRVTGTLVVVVMNFAIAIGLGVSPTLAIPVGGLRCGVTDRRADGTANPTTDDGAVAPTHGIANDRTGNRTNAATNRRTKGIGTCVSGEEEPGKQQREDESGNFHSAHLLDRVKVRQR
jgi:hypothetical protein